MVPEPTNPIPTEGDMHKQLDRDVRDMISALTQRLTDLQKPGRSRRRDDHGGDDDDSGVRIITLAGSNVGATMRSEMDEKESREGVSVGEQEPLSTLVNSNFQAINNSIMLGGSYSTNDPGVHMDVSDFTDNHPATHHKHGKKGKKKDKETSKEDRTTEHSS